MVEAVTHVFADRTGRVREQPGVVRLRAQRSHHRGQVLERTLERRDRRRIARCINNRCGTINYREHHASSK